MKNSIRTKIISCPQFTLLIIVLLFVLTGCDEKSSQTIAASNISAEDIERIRKINKDYTEGWLENDSTKVLGHYSDSATIIPSGLMPIQGKKAITEFWFPKDNSTTVIHYYDLEILNISGGADHAYTYEHGKLSFTYIKDDFRMDREAESYAVTIYEKGELEKWKIIKRI